MKLLSTSSAILLFLSSSSLLYPTLALTVSSHDATNGRRAALQNIFGSAASLAFVSSAFADPASALDMDAFIDSQLESDTKNCDPKRDPKCKPTLSQDQALCKYGQSGEARGEACLRVKAAGGQLSKPGSGGKSLGGAYAI